MIRQVHVYRIVAEMVLGVNADTEREALDRAQKMAEGRPASEWKPTAVSTVALIYVGDNEGPVRLNCLPTGWEADMSGTRGCQIVCCFIDERTGLACSSAAEYTLWAGDGGRPEHYTETCPWHIADLMTDAYIHHLHRLEATGVAP